MPDLFPNEDDIFKKFSDSARKILTQSQRIARDMGSGINSEHILLALTTSPGTIAYELLNEYLINIDQIRLILSLRGRETTLQTGISSFAKRVLEIAAQSAYDFGHIHIDAEHILLGVVSFPDCLAYQIIARIGIDPKTIQKQIIKLFDELNHLDQHSSNHNHEHDFDEDVQPVLQPIRGKRKAIKTSVLDYFATDLTAQAQANQLDPVIGRKLEIERLIQVLTRRTKNNPVLIGEPGVGKTAIVEGLAQKIANHQVPNILANRKIFLLDLALLIAGTTYRGQFEERLKKVMQEVKKDPNIIIFIDEFHTVVGAGSAEGTMDAANIIKPALSKGQFRLIGATTTTEYRKYIEKDAALERRMQKIIVPEPSIEETIAILEGVKKNYEKHHHVMIDSSAIKAAAIYAHRFIQDRFLPDKAIDLIDEAASAVHIKRMPKDNILNDLEDQLAKLTKQKETAFSTDDFTQAANLRSQEIKVLQKLNDQKKNYHKNKEKVTEKDIANVVTAWTGIPVGDVIKEEQIRLRALEHTLGQLIIGQDNAIKAIASTIRRAKTGISSPTKPLGSFLFLGPTGVGKTYLTQVLAKTIYASESALIKIDMSEFMERHNISRLIGAPPGYVGFENAGKLTESIRQQPFSVVLFDEIEKAHPEIFNILLQILEDGQLTDAGGKQVSFKNTIVIMTSNIGSDRLTKQAAIGFHTGFKKSDQEEYEQTKQVINQELQEHFKPELLNRLDNTIFFEPLNKNSIVKIVDKELTDLGNRLKQEGYQLIFAPDIAIFLAQKGYNPSFGVRPLKRIITELIEDKLADLLLSGKIKKPAVLKIELVKQEIIIKSNSTVKIIDHGSRTARTA